MNRFVTAALAAVIGMAGAVAAHADGEVTHRVLGVDRGKIAILDEHGQVAWQVPGGYEDVSMLPNGNILMQTGNTTVSEMAPDKTIVWKYTAKASDGCTGQVSVHSFERLDNGNTLIALSGERRLIEVDKAGTIVHDTPFTVDHPNKDKDTRLVRKLANGNYLCTHELDGVVREFDPSGRVVWSYKLDLDGKPATGGGGGHGTFVFSVLRLPNGNTLIGTGDGNRVVEITPDGKEVWRVAYDELPGIHLCWITSLEVLPNGDIVFGNTHAGPANPQLIEINRDKKVIWTLNNREVFGNDMAAAQIVDPDLNGKILR